MDVNAAVQCPTLVGFIARDRLALAHARSMNIAKTGEIAGDEDRDRTCFGSQKTGGGIDAFRHWDCRYDRSSTTSLVAMSHCPDEGSWESVRRECERHDKGCSQQDVLL